MNPAKEVKKDVTTIFVEDLKRIIHKYYSEQLSESVKRGIAAKRRQNETNK